MFLKKYWNDLNIIMALKQIQLFIYLFIYLFSYLFISHEMGLQIPIHNNMFRLATIQCNAKKLIQK